jgi:hypothetical protein
MRAISFIAGWVDSATTAGPRPRPDRQEQVQQHSSALGRPRPPRTCVTSGATLVLARRRSVG